MRIRRLVAAVLAVAIQATADAGEALAFTSSIAVSEKTKAYSPSPGKMQPYGARLHSEVLSEIRHSVLPFRLEGPATVQVIFAVNRRGELVQFALEKKSGWKIINDYAAVIVRQASRRFPPPPASQPGDPLAYRIPITFQLP